MHSPLLYLSNKALFCKQEDNVVEIECQAIENYKNNLEEIKQRKEWKTQGSGAMFTGMAYRGEQEYNPNCIFPSDAIFTDDNDIIYSARLENGTAIYSKSLTDKDKPEGLILRKNDFVVYDMNYDSTNKRLALSASVRSYERHIAILELDSASAPFLTEGDSHDCNPYFDPQNSNVLYYDSCGFAYNQQNDLVGIGPKGICQLNLETGDLDEIMIGEKYEYFKPQLDNEGNLYFIKRPYKTNHHATFSLKDIIFAPVKITRAIVGWLDFFTQRYAGESLKTTTGSNPAKEKEKTDEELFIEGNLINVKKSLEANQKTGEKFPGIIPQSWELIKRSPAGEMSVLKKGILSYSLGSEGVLFYSNGKHLIKVLPDNSEILQSEGEPVLKISF